MKTKLKLSLRSDFELLPIGTRVSYHHRAGIARFKKQTNYEDERKGWILVEGTLPGPELVKADSDPVWIDGYNWNRVKDMFFDWPQARTPYTSLEKVNKTIMVWPEDGFGWIIGIKRKSIGVSSPGYARGPEYESGYHSTLMYVDLYVVKPWYEGVDYVLCPLWAVKEVKDDE